MKEENKIAKKHARAQNKRISTVGNAKRKHMVSKCETSEHSSPAIPAYVLRRSLESSLLLGFFPEKGVVFYIVYCGASVETIHKTLYEIQLI